MPRSEIDRMEENRYGGRPDPDKIVKVTVLHCRACGGEITELLHADGERHYVEFGVRSVLGEGVYHAACPSLREEDLRHDADTERNGPPTDD